MAINDIKYDTTPTNTNQQSRGPSITALRSALSTFNSTSYSSARLDAMTERDMRWAVKQHNLTVTGE